MEQAEEDQQQTSSPLQLRSGTVRRRAQQVPCVSVRLYEVPVNIDLRILKVKRI